MFQILSKCLLALMLTSFASLSATARFNERLLPLQTDVNHDDSAITAEDGTPIVEVVMGAHGTAFMSWTPFEP